MGIAEPGTVVAGRYRLRTVIGRGGMGIVWLANDELLQRDVAVKEIIWPPQLDLAERENLRQRAFREARTAARLDHPNIVGVYDVVEDDGRPWIVMRFVPYRSLNDVVAEDGPLSPSQAAQVGLQILAAIQTAHAGGVLHRDVKPGNVLLGPDGKVVLTDFGMATADGSPALTTAGVLIGSPAYMAPERARGELASPAADLWSVGATLYAAVEGRPPFERDTMMAVLTAVVTDDPDPPSRAGPLWPVISGLLRKDPAARLEAGELEGMLARVADNHAAVPVGAPEEPTAPVAGGHHEPTSPPEHGPRRAPPVAAATTRPQWRASDDGTADLGLALIPGLEPSPQKPLEPPGPRPPTPPEPQRRRHPRLRRLIAAVDGFALAVAIAAAIGIASAVALIHMLGSPAAPRASHGPSPARQGGPAPSSPASPAPSSSSNNNNSVTLPAGFSWYHDPSGFSIAVPTGWAISHQGHIVYVRDPGSSRFLLIDQTSHPKPDPLADWRQQEASRISSYPGYHRIRLQAVRYAQGVRTADWEFTYYRNGQLVHVLNRNVLTSAHLAYALYWSTPASEWDASFHFFQTFAATFRPAGANTGS